MITALPSSIFMRTLRFCKCIKCLLYPSCHCMPSLPHRGHSLIIHHVTSLIQILHCLSVNQFVKPSAHFSSCNILPHSNILTSAKAPNINVLVMRYQTEFPITPVYWVLHHPSCNMFNPILTLNPYLPWSCPRSFPRITFSIV